MKKFNFLSKSSSQSCGHSSVTLASTVGSPSVHGRGTTLRLLSVLVLIFTFGIGQMWGDSYSLTPDQASTGSSSTSYITTLTEFTHPTSNGISWKMDQWNPSTLQIKTNQSSATSEFRFYNTSAFPGRITQVVITFQSLTVSDASKLMFLGGTSEVTATTGGTAGTWNSTDKTLTWTPGASDNFTFFAFYQDGKAASGTNNLASSDAIVVTYDSKYSVTYQANGASSGSVPTDNSKYAKNTTVTVLGNTGNLERTGCTFAGWNTKEDGTGTTYAADATFSISANTTLYAKWTATVTWKANNVIVKTDDIVVPAAGKTVTLPTDGEIGANKCGDRIMGWTESETHKANTAPADLFTAAPTVQGSKTYYAVFADYAE